MKHRATFVFSLLSAAALCSFVYAAKPGVADQGPLRDVPQTTGPVNGSLLIVGGGGNPKYVGAMIDRFVELAGGEKARIVVVPTAASCSPDYDYANYNMMRRIKSRYKVKSVTVVHTHDRKVADTETFVKPLAEATGIWFSGGRQWRFTKAYRGTRAEKAFADVLNRGGVIGGSSAGATIQGSFLARGDTKGNRQMVGDFQHGFGYINNAAIDQHIVPRKRQLDMLKVLDKPDGPMLPEFNRQALLGIGVDEDTAIEVHGDTFKVIGKPDGKVFVYDPRKWQADTQPHDKYVTLVHGQRYDMRKRAKLPRGD